MGEGTSEKEGGRDYERSGKEYEGEKGTEQYTPFISPGGRRRANIRGGGGREGRGGRRPQPKPALHSLPQLPPAHRPAPSLTCQHASGPPHPGLGGGSTQTCYMYALTPAESPSAPPFTCEHAPRPILRADVLQLDVVLQEEVEILPGDVDGEVGAALAMLLQSGTAARERVLVDLRGRTRRYRAVQFWVWRMGEGAGLCICEGWIPTSLPPSLSPTPYP